MKYQIAEKFKSVQGEGVYAGTPMAFIRFTGCSVGKKICHYCDTDFDKTYNWRGGGEFSEDELLHWADNYEHICLTGGEPFDQNLDPIFDLASTARTIHIESSGTVNYKIRRHPEMWWLCVSPKPGFKEEIVHSANEVKVIVPGLGNGEGWPTINDALRWADAGKIVFLQPKNDKLSVDKNNLRIVQDIIAQYPQLRLSVQLHKILGVQ